MYKLNNVVRNLDTCDFFLFFLMVLILMIISFELIKKYHAKKTLATGGENSDEENKDQPVKTAM